MPWEQIENTTIRIEATPPSTAPFTQSERAPLLGGDSDPVPSAPTQSESVAEQFANPLPAPGCCRRQVSRSLRWIRRRAPRCFQSLKFQPRPSLIPLPRSHFHGTLSSTAHGSLPQELRRLVRLPHSPSRMRFTGCEGIRISSTRARISTHCPLHYINSRTALLIHPFRAVAMRLILRS